MSKVELIAKLEQTVHQLYQKYSIDKNQKIYAKFDRTLFSESFETFSFYMDEVESTLSKLKKIGKDNPHQYQFYCQKLVSQCSVLDEAISRGNRIFNNKNNLIAKPALLSKREKLKAQLNQLPPRERLQKYYESLNALNQKLEKEEGLLYQANTFQEKQLYTEQVETTKKRRTRCLDAIEMLEEYLAFKENLENETTN